MSFQCQRLWNTRGIFARFRLDIRALVVVPSIHGVSQRDAQKLSSLSSNILFSIQFKMCAIHKYTHAICSFKELGDFQLEANHSKSLEVPFFFATDSHP